MRTAAKLCVKPPSSEGQSGPAARGLVGGLALLVCAAAPAPAQWSYDVVHSFGTNEGASPQAALILASDGQVYGAACVDGGPGVRGTIFRLEDTDAVTVLHTFQPSEGGGCPEELLHVFNSYTECAEPTGRLVEGLDGFLYGTCSRALYNNGIAYRIDSAGTFTILHYFDQTVEAIFPLGGLIRNADGTFFGTLAYGGSGSLGGVFSMTASGDVTTIHAFSGPDGASPFSGLLIGSESRLYGTTLRGGPSDRGTIFSLDPDGGNFLSLHAFDGTDGSDPFTGLIELADGFYGTTNDTLPALGTVFQLNRSGTLTTLHSFGAPGDGRNPHGGLLAVDPNTVLGTTALGGASSQGTIFRLARQ